MGNTIKSNDLKVLQTNNEDTQSSSDMEMYPLASSPSVFANVLSPLDGTTTNSWNTKGDKTPHGIKKSPVSRIKPVFSYTTTPATSEARICPLPEFSWASSKEVWKLMCAKDMQASERRDPVMFTRHPSLQPRMRAILFDWLIEVCEVYKLHRETYYLAIDYLDRFLSAKDNVQKTHLQLIGITCLFLAAKVSLCYLCNSSFI
jgi:G1/S-specific cyclin-E1